MDRIENAQLFEQVDYGELVHLVVDAEGELRARSAARQK